MGLYDDFYNGSYGTPYNSYPIIRTSPAPQSPPVYPLAGLAGLAETVRIEARIEARSKELATQEQLTKQKLLLLEDV